MARARHPSAERYKTCHHLYRCMPTFHFFQTFWAKQQSQSTTIHFCRYEASERKKTIKLGGINSRHYFQSFATKSILRRAWHAPARVQTTLKSITSLSSDDEFAYWPHDYAQPGFATKAVFDILPRYEGNYYIETYLSGILDPDAHLRAVFLF